MKEEDRHRSEPPRLLLGASLLFWSGMIGHPLVGLLCAVLVEGRAWFSVRWDFGERAFIRTWTSSVVLLILGFAWNWMDGAGTSSLFRVLSWLPVYFLPLILVQQYATSRWMLLNTFSLFARRKMQVDRRKGREVDPMKVHFGYVYLLLVLIAAALGQTSREVYYIGLCTFIALALYFAGNSSRQRPVGWGISVALAMVIGFSGAKLMGLAYQYFSSGQFLAGRSTTFPSEQMTSIGRVGELKQSQRIQWRVRADGVREPSLYREAVFNKYGQGLWRHVAGGGLSQTEDWANEMATRGDQGDADYRFVFDRSDLDIDEEGAVKIEITGSLEIPGPTAIPLPSQAQMLRGLQADGVDYNSLGTVIVVNPDTAVTRFEAYLGNEVRHEEAPYSETDLTLPYAKQYSDDEAVSGDIPSRKSDAFALMEVVDELGIRGMSAGVVMARLQQFFNDEFQYTLYQSERGLMGAGRRGAIATFLLDPYLGRKGHCEYFATAATLLLREAGIPARYAVGYAAKERGSGKGEWVLRGKHRHAWCRVYVGGHPGEASIGVDGDAVTQWAGGQWMDFDPTPPNWLAIEGSGLPWEQKVLDFLQIVRQEMSVWRSRAENRNLISWVMGIVGALTLAYVLVRLWSSRLRRSGRDNSGGSSGEIDSPPSPLLILAGLLEKRLGPRPQGLPFTEWVRSASVGDPVLRDSLEQAIHFHWRIRFDPLGLEEEEFQRFRALCQILKQELR